MKDKKFSMNRKMLQNLILILVLIALMIFFYIQNPRFMALVNWTNLAKQNVQSIFVGCAMALIIITGGIDLSVGSVMALVAVSFVYLCGFGINIWVAALICLGIGALVGILNAFLIIKMRLTPIIATIATWTSISGLAYTLCKAIPVQADEMKPITILNTGTVGVIPYALFFMIIAIAVFMFLEKKTVLGKYCVAIGGNENAAIFSGINVDRIKLIIYVLSGIMAAMAGIIATARSGQGDPTTGAGMETVAIAGCVLGGIDMKGGEGSVFGMVLGTVTLAVIKNGMNMMGVQSFYQQVATGLVILVAVLINFAVSKKTKHGKSSKKKKAAEAV
ncbi:ABC transporter permease [Chakrabartyella piscis]|uniref:ABC transporter permease n=1 Tax=Chakrabartyella piscis TaxID=2918914 RepID=UPI00295873CF|nr:ABC transporter permease [Chakrabartyella piscis]